MTEEKILLVDDEEDFTSVLAERMRNRGMNVETAETGSEALSKVKDQGFDAVVLDMVMPGMDGIETLKKMLEENPELQVILLTGHGTIEKSVEAVKLGALDFLEKPAKLDKLLELIEEAKGRKMVLVQKRLEDKISDIIHKKSW